LPFEASLRAALWLAAIGDFAAASDQGKSDSRGPIIGPPQSIRPFFIEPNRGLFFGGLPL
jgi:hypothetical protein